MSERNEVPYQLYLQVKSRAKVIPYPSAQHEDSINIGFQNLKGKPEIAAAIPEAQDLEALKNALIDINDSTTAFFTVGCEKARCNNETGHYISGFLEISFNYKKLVADAQYYFKLFFDFNKYLESIEYKTPVLFTWEIEPAHFKEVNMMGYTVVVWICSGYTRDPQNTEKFYSDALETLVAYLKTIPLQNLERIY